MGNIGSQTAVALTRLGLKDFYLYDPDFVEPHNLSSQAYTVNDLKSHKSESLMQILRVINPKVTILSLPEKYNGTNNIGNILIIAVDSMKERKRIYQNLLEHNLQHKMIIDGRMGGPQLEIYTCKTLEEWEKTFVDNPSKDPCGARYICYISMIIGALIANQVKRVLKGETYKKSILFNIDSLQLI